MTASDLLVDRTDGHRLRVAAADTAGEGGLAPGQVLLRVDSFGLSTNNVTYAALGDALGYWRFFPAPEGWGRVPVWGFADVARSRHPDLAEGERVFGFLPMSTPPGGGAGAGAARQLRRRQRPPRRPAGGLQPLRARSAAGCACSTTRAGTRSSGSTPPCSTAASTRAWATSCPRRPAERRCRPSASRR